MPVERLVQADQPKIMHWVMKIGYNTRNGGCGNVTAMVTAQPMLINQAEISRVKRNGHSWKSLRAQL